MANEKDKKEYKTGQMQDNGLMYDPLYDYNKDGKVDWVEDIERQKDMERAQEMWEEQHNETREQKQYSPAPQASGASAGGCLGSFLVVLFCLGGIGMCFTTESAGLKILFIFGGISLALASAYFCGILGTKEQNNKEPDAAQSAVETATQRTENAVQADKAKLIKRIAVVSAIVIAVVLLCNIGNMKKAHYYHQAINLINTGEYESARQYLSKIEDKYKEKSELYSFCIALEHYDKGESVHGPNYSYDCYCFDFKFSDEIENKKLAINEQLEKRAKEYEQKAYTNRNDGSGNKPSEKKTTTTAATTRKSYSSGSSKKSRSKSKTIDPYDVKNYSNEEDFYYDHYDDFVDYYEAEDYYNEHHD